jgi:hypothetical protein
MDVKVVVGDAKPCFDLARRLAMVYELLLRRAEETETGHKEACEGREVGGNPSRGQRESNLNIWNSNPARPALRSQ